MKQESSSERAGSVQLAAPYSHNLQEIVEARIEVLCSADATLMSKGIMTISPLLKHLVRMHSTLPGDWAYWGDYSKVLLSKCDAMIVLTLEGWKESTGVQAEINFAKKNNIDVYYISPNDVYAFELD